MSASDHISASQAQRLDQEDFDALAKIADPGYSVRAFGPDAGSNPRDSYMVSHSEYNAPVMPYSNVSGKTIGDFISSRETPLRRPRMYAGAWTEHDEETGDPTSTYLDVSEAMPRTHAGRTAAIKRGVDTGEKALGVVNEYGDYVNEINLVDRNPLQEWSSTFMESPDSVIGHFKKVHSGERRG